MRPISGGTGPVTASTRPLLACAVVAGTILSASPAHAEVTFDFAANTGFAGATELRQAFGWDAPALREHAADIALTKDTLIQDVYSVVCGPAGTRPVRAVHAREFGTWFLTTTVDRHRATGKPAGETAEKAGGNAREPVSREAPGGSGRGEVPGGPDRGEVRGLRITGAGAAISGTTVPPMPDMPCPGSEDDPSRSTVLPPGPAPSAGTIRSVTLVSTTTTMTLIAKSGDTTRELMELRTGPEVPG